MKSTLILAAALVAAAAANPAPAVARDANGNQIFTPGVVVIENGSKGGAYPGPAGKKPCTTSSAQQVVPTRVPPPAPTGVYEGVSPYGKKPCTTAAGGQVTVAPTQPTQTARNTTVTSTTSVQQNSTSSARPGQTGAAGALTQATASSAGKVGGSVVALLAAGAGLLAL